MAKLVARRERRWRMFWDTVYFDEASVPRPGRYTPFDVKVNPRRLFTDWHDGSLKTNCDCAGSFPAGHSYHLTEIGVRVDLTGPLADDALRALLRCMQVELSVGQHEMATIPPGGFYPPGLTLNRDAHVATLTQPRASAEGPIPPLVLEPSPPWLTGGFCRFMPVARAITIPPFQNYYILLTLDGVGLRLLAKLQAEGLLQGELAVLLNGMELREVL